MGDSNNRRPFGERTNRLNNKDSHHTTDEGQGNNETGWNGEAAGKLAASGKHEGKRDRSSKKRSSRERSYCLSDFVPGELIGSGRYGRVYYARDRKHERDVALKRLTVDGVSIDRYRQFEREIQIQGHLDHPNVIRLYGFFNHADKLFLVLEYAKEGSLFDLLQKLGRLKERTVAHILRSMIQALSHLHARGIIHRDLKPENILIGNDGTPKLTDFGWSILSKDRRYTMCGTLDYVAPEMMMQNGYDHRVDIWSLGVLCYELLIGYPPFCDKSTSSTTKKIQNVKYLFPNELTISEAAEDFIKSVLIADPDRRLGLEDMMEHIFLRRH